MPRRSDQQRILGGGDDKESATADDGQSRTHIVEELDESSVRTAQFAISSDGVVEYVRDEVVTAQAAFTDRVLGVWRYLLDVFLPAGYPHSVTEDYIHYQIYDSLQAFCSSIAGLLSSRAVLSSVGVGDSSASPTSALLLSVLQESTGRVATIAFAHRLGTSLEPECKSWRLAADVFNDAAMVLDCLSPAIPRREVRVAVLSVASALRALCGVAAGSAKASLSAHFAKRGNLGEVNAKDSSQETVISLVGMLAGTFVVSAVTSAWATWLALLLLLALHLATNYLAVRAVNMNTLNRQRANIVFSHLFAASSKTKPALRPDQVSEAERIFDMNGGLRTFDITDGLPRGRRTVGRVRIGVSLSQLVTAMGNSGSEIGRVIDLFQEEQFLLWPPAGPRDYCICLKDGAVAQDILKAWALALYSAGFRPVKAKKLEEKGHHLEALESDYKHVRSMWASCLKRLEAQGWDLTIASIETGKARRLRFRKEE